MVSYGGSRREQQDDLWNAAGRGFLAGGLGTVPMTVAMLAMHRRLPARQRYDLPHQQIVEDLLSMADSEQALSREEIESLSLAAHFSYGSFLGAIYGILARRRPAWSGIGGGIAFGLAAWCGGYLGWLPALQIRARATNEPARRNAMMIASHILWGAAAGYLQKVQQAESATTPRSSRGHFVG